MDDVTPLLFAAQSGDAECVRLLLARGAKVDARNSKNQKVRCCRSFAPMWVSAEAASPD